MLVQSSGTGTQPRVVVVVDVEVDVVVEVEVVVVTQMMWFWLHVPFGSQPAVVHESLSVSVQGVLSGFGVKTHMPLVWSHAAVVQSVSVHVGHSWMEPDCELVDCSPLSQVASNVSAT
jgi:hypothetical protein